MQVYSVTPESCSPDETFTRPYRDRLTTTAQASEKAGWTGILVPHNLHELDPWLLAGHLGSVTGALVPLLAVQPACVPPHAAAALAAAYAELYDRPVYFNLVAGARDDELRRIGDDRTHDERYARLREYGLVLRSLLCGESVDLDAEFYSYRGHSLTPRPAILSDCRIFVAGSSEASLRAARAVADVVVTHPQPFAEWRRDFLEPLRASGFTGDIGIRVGLLCRADAASAWRLARERFPESWQGRQETMLKTMSQNVWSRRLAQRAVAEPDADNPEDPYWLGAFRSGRASAPFLVGSYSSVAARLAEYVGAGVGHLLLNGSTEDDYDDIAAGIRLAESPS